MFALRCENLGIRYASGPLVLNNFHLQIAQGEIVGIAGESGSGKTTLLRAVAGLLPPCTGTLQSRAPVAYIPQESLVSLSPFLTVAAHFQGVCGSGSAYLESVGLRGERILRSHPHQLSGGERQRVLFALALATSPKLLIADEPTAHLDSAHVQRLLSLLSILATNGTAILIATHQEHLFEALNCRIVRLTPEPVPAPPYSHPSPSTNTLAEVRNLRKTYYRRDAWLRRQPMVEALKGVSLRLGRAETTILRGPSGAGKSTLARCLAGWESYDAGSITWPSGRPRVQIVPQSPSDSVNPNFSVAASLREAGVDPRRELLAQVGLPEAALQRKVTALSEGQRARLAILRATEYCRDGLLILDESLAGLDVSTRNLVLSYLQSRPGLTTLLLTHDDHLAGVWNAPVVSL